MDAWVSHPHCVERTATGKKPAPGAAYEYGAKQDGRRLICVYSGNQKLVEETLKITKNSGAACHPKIRLSQASARFDDLDRRAGKIKNCKRVLKICTLKVAGKEIDLFGVECVGSLDAASASRGQVM